MSVVVRDAVTDFRRRALLRTLVATPSADLLADVAERAAVWEVFEDQADLVRALQDHWLDLLTHAVHAEPVYPLGSDRVRELYADLTGAHPTLRGVLDVRQDDDDIWHELVEERILLARAAGHLDQVSSATLSWRGRDLVEQVVPRQREG